ncbi:MULTISPECIES: DUF982 domain-containing protein [unclassified Mesorhizobium]|uniref:DUF982 domain-containing protein n=1 Tax=unclassified Mesorhizobium TaxID=325217 RepID=UPI002416CBA8|nr:MULTISPECIES: DUF982 domain-containing protein [unclassified Mesorhizobium]MDG4903511.1 DUF982 domain-containing protein [Mesorhizobium sp. WSM4962]MDG4921439.1 DUF982 domain-containing protein [Mesorhizobium sp. WSM4989]
MNNQNFRVPLVLYDHRLGFCLICSVSQAADFLFAYWEEYDSPAWSQAMDCCSSVKLGAAGPEQVSSAFITAVKDAGMTVDPTLRLY